MAVVDERGRLFGRWNLLDLALLVLLLGAIPLAYAAFLLFRDQPPRLVSVEPAVLPQSDVFTLRIKGENFRPYMRLSLGAQQGREFQFRNTGEAEVQFPAVAPGKYDVILYDQAQERFRLPQAVTISPSELPATQIVAIGAFGNLDAARAAKFVAGAALPGTGEIVTVGKPIPDLTQVFVGSTTVGVPLAAALRLPAVVRFNCYIKLAQGSPICQVNDVTVAAKSLFLLQTPAGAAPFQVQRVRGPHALEAVRVTLRIGGHPSVLSRIKAGDTDTGGADSDLEPLARVAQVGAVRTLAASSAEVDVTLTANVQRVDGRLLYDSAPIRLGSPLVLRTNAYEVGGVVIDIVEPRQ